MKKNLAILLSALLFFSCATTHSGRSALAVKQPADIDLEISVKLNGQYSDATNFYYDFTIENKGGSYLRIDQVTLDFEDGQKIPHNVVVGQDLVAWAESYAIRREKEKFNGDLGTAALVLTGAALMIAGAASGRSDQSRALVEGGTALVGAGAAWDGYRNIKSARDKVMNAKWVPESHLMSAVTVPSSGFAQRWILINLPQRRIARKALLKIKTVEGQEAVYEVALTGGKS